MTTDKAVESLLHVPAFAGLKPQQIAEIARHTKRLKFLRGDIITRSGQFGDGAYLIVSGPAEQVIGHGAGAQKQPVEPGSLIGEMAMLIEHVYGSTVIAGDWVYCLKITRSAMHAQMVGDPSLAEHFERRVTDRLLQVMEELRKIEGTFGAVGAQQIAHPGPPRAAMAHAQRPYA